MGERVISYKNKVSLLFKVPVGWIPREMKFHAWDLGQLPTSVLSWPLDYVTATEISMKIFPILFYDVYSILLDSFCYP
jgi:hypothetical protein